jgi:hypothetical protein
MDIAHYRPFGPPRIIDECELKKTCKLLHLKFENKEIDAVNIYIILNHKNVQSCIPTYFKIQSTPCISYTWRYTSSIASKLITNVAVPRNRTIKTKSSIVLTIFPI